MNARNSLTVDMVPALLELWDDDKNLPLLPREVSAQSHKVCWWKCELGHSWSSPVDARKMGKSGCRFCSNQELLVGFNDLATTRPDLAAQWNFQRNDPLMPTDLVAGANRKVWWICDKGHEWEANCGSRNNRNSGCPYCSGRKSVVGETDLESTHPEIASQWDYDKNGSLKPTDLSAGSGQKVWWVCSEGHEWEATVHKRKAGRGCPYCSRRKSLKGETDIATNFPEVLETWNASRNVGISPNELLAGSKQKVWWICEKGHEYQKSPYARLLKKSGCPACSHRTVITGANDLPTTNPELAKQWHPTKNLPWHPYEVVAGSNRKFWWVCDKNHEWETTVSSRASQGTGCPYCSNQKVWSGFNDLATTNPELANEWHPTRNGSLLPSGVIAGTAKKFWWICDKGHEWEANCGSRAVGSGCPYCSNQKVMVGFNDLSTSHPELVIEWDTTKNFPELPQSFATGSNKKVWWLCSEGHSWKASVASRTSRGTGCPSCSRIRFETGLNDFATTDPELAKEWHPTKNLPLTPSQVVASSKEKVWWLCPNGHDYQTTIGSRHNQHTGCPYCAGTKVLQGFNDLATTHPELANEWHSTKNGDFYPQSVTRGTRNKAWWQCNQGHEWEATIANRVWGNSCPYCAGQWLLPGENDLSTKNPELAKEWHPTKNGELLPTQVFAATGKAYWWICTEGHSWRAKVSNRKWGNGCPQCSKAGYISTTPGILYFIEHHELKARKIGITNVDAKKNRVNGFIKAGWSVVTQIRDDNGQLILDLETEMLRWVRNDLGLPAYLGAEDMRITGGASETFSADGVSNYEVLEQIELVYSKLKQTHSDTYR